MSDIRIPYQRCPGSGGWAQSRTPDGYSCPHCTATDLKVTFHRDDILGEHTRVARGPAETIDQLLHNVKASTLNEQGKLCQQQPMPVAFHDAAMMFSLTAISEYYRLGLIGGGPVGRAKMRNDMTLMNAGQPLARQYALLA